MRSKEFDMYWKAYRWQREGLKLSKVEMVELQKYMEKRESFEICERLKIAIESTNE